MTQLFPILPRCHVSALRLITGLAVVTLLALTAGCGMTSRPNTPASPTPTPTPTPDNVPPTSTITSPTAGATVAVVTTVTITGTANDTGGGSVARVDVSVDGGITYNTAMGTTTWSYNWTPTSPGPASIRSRAVDSSGNQQTTPAAITVTVVGSPPEVVSTTPAPGATGVSTGIAPTVTFSKALDFRSMSNGTSILLRDASNNPIHFFSVYDSGPSKFVLLPQQQLHPGQKYTVTFKGGPNAPHITDEAGTPLASDYTLSFTTAPAPQITTSTIFAPADMPDNPMANDQSSVELGLKFRSDKDGLIAGVRFYKGGAANGGQHLGRLWTIDGTLLGSVTFANETDSGWQQALFQTPIPITANTTYVVSYFAPQGNYAEDNNDFASSGVDNAPLHALSDAAAGGNGVFLRSSTGGFPTDSSMATNYWVDVAFIDSGTFAPQVVSVTPAPNEFNIFTTVAPTATFSEPLDPASVNESTVLARDMADNPVPVAVSYDASAFRLTITPVAPLPMLVDTVTIKGGASGPHVTDATGTPLAYDYTWSFVVTRLPPALPILVITTTGNKFTQYYQELLRSEGFNSVNAMDITQITSSTLAQYDVAILGETTLTSAQVTMLSDWVTAGGNLIAPRPDKQLASLLGITGASSVQSEVYLPVNTAQEPGVSIIDQNIQYHGPADLYTLNGAAAAASIYSNPTQSTSNPVATLHSMGTNGGQVAAFTFDLARSIADPQADELRRLLRNIILLMIADSRTLPRLW
jgi:Domain of unknown function (DUF4082)/Bacterial Ig-like domain/Bacterial Ig domain